jgi:hypothetical protein
VVKVLCHKSEGRWFDNDSEQAEQTLDVSHTALIEGKCKGGESCSKLSLGRHTYRIGPR